MRESLMCPSRSEPQEGHDPTDLENAVLDLLEEANIPEEINDRIMRLIELGERRTAGERDNLPTVRQALLAISPYGDPADDPDTGRAMIVRVLMRELGLKPER